MDSVKRMPRLGALPVRLRPTYPAVFVTAFALLLGASAFPASTAAQTPATTATIRPHVSQSGDGMTLEVTAEDVSNLAGFEMLLSWDTNVLSFVDAPGGQDLLAGSGRKPYCPDPIVQDTVVRVACVTFAPPAPAAAGEQPPAPPPGVDGSGLLQTFHFKVIGSGRTDLTLSMVDLVDPDGVPLNIQVVGSDGNPADAGGALTVPVTLKGIGGGSGLLWPLAGGLGGALALVVVGAAVVFYLRRRRPHTRDVGLADVPDPMAPGR